MKKYSTFIVIIILAILLLIVCIFSNSGTKSNTKLSNDATVIMANLEEESANISSSQEGIFGAEINVSDYLELYNKEDEYSLVWVARPTCTYCQLASPVVKKIIKDYSIYISYLNTDNLSDEEITTFENSDSKFNEGFGTPMMLLVGDGKLLDMINGATDTAHYIKFLKKYKFIEEE